MMRHLSLGLCAALAALAAPVVAHAETDVTQVVVHGHSWSPYARLQSKVPGPAMWKLTRGTGTVWVLAVLDEAPAGLVWDDRFFKSKLAGARRLITPGAAAFSPAGEARYRRGSILPAGTTLKDRVTAATYGRLSETVAREKALKLETYTGFTPEHAGAELYDSVLAWHHIDGDIPQIAQAAALAAEAQVPVEPALRFDGDATTDRLLTLSAAGNEACLVGYLDGIDYDLATLPQVTGAWTQGDVTNVSLAYHDTPSLTCDQQAPGWMDTVAVAETRMAQAIDDALGQPGDSVAVMRFSQLLHKGGILDQLQARGVEIAPAE